MDIRFRLVALLSGSCRVVSSFLVPGSPCIVLICPFQCFFVTLHLSFPSCVFAPLSCITHTVLVSWHCFDLSSCYFVVLPFSWKLDRSSCLANPFVVRPLFLSPRPPSNEIFVLDVGTARGVCLCIRLTPWPLPLSVLPLASDSLPPPLACAFALPLCLVG